MNSSAEGGQSSVSKWVPFRSARSPHSVQRSNHFLQVYKPWYSFNNRSFSPPMALTAGTGPSFDVDAAVFDFDLPTMASKAHVPNSHRKYDLEADGITIISHTPPRRMGADARDVANWTRNGGKSKNDPLVIDDSDEDSDEVQEIYETSSNWPSRPGTSWQTATNSDMTVSTTLAFLPMVVLGATLESNSRSCDTPNHEFESSSLERP